MPVKLERLGQAIVTRRLNLYWLTMALAVFAAVMLILSFAGVFSGFARKLNKTLSQQQQNTASLSPRLTTMQS